MGLFKKDGISLNNIIGFAADTTNVMFGEHNSISVASRLKEKIPDIFLMCCICHSAHLCASYQIHMPVKSFPVQLKNFFVMCTTTFATVPNVKQSRAFQSFAEVEPHKLLHPCQTRWLSLHACVSRVIEQWDVLIQYFQAVVDQDNLLVSQKILNHLQNPIWKLYFHFLDFVLPKFTEVNIMFQSAKTSIHCLHNGLQTIYRDFLSCYMREAYWGHTPLQEIDPTSQVNFLPLPTMYSRTSE